MNPNEDRTPEIALRGVTMHYGGDAAALSHIDLEVEKGEFLSLVGPSGCGKSTLLRLISGLQRPTGGTVSVRGQAVDTTPPELGFMFQRDALLPWASVRQNIEIGLECGGYPKTGRRDRIDELLAITGLGAFGDAYPHALSGGMRQRVALARILAYEPGIFLMDEPFGALDAQTKVLMGQELLDIWGRQRKAVVFVTHDIEEAVSLSDRVIVMTGRPGRVRSEYHIDLARPRGAREIRGDARFRDYVQAIWNDIVNEVGTASARVH